MDNTTDPMYRLRFRELPLEFEPSVMAKKKKQVISFTARPQVEQGISGEWFEPS
jgi:hypothetical protein